VEKDERRNAGAAILNLIGLQLTTDIADDFNSRCLNNIGLTSQCSETQARCAFTSCDWSSELLRKHDGRTGEELKAERK